MNNIAVLLTCHNRKGKTLSCLKSLYEACDAYNALLEGKVKLTVYLTDDGCTDGTADAVKALLPDRDINILQGDGNLFWAGGMRFAWREAMKRHQEWDYYLLVNDDVVMMDNVFGALIETEKYSVEKFGKKGLVSGITCAKDDPNKLTYGGNVWVNRFLATSRRLAPNGEPQLCDLTNANILLVPATVVDAVGIFYDKYAHGKADYDYSFMVRKAGFPVVLTADFCGKCDNDHVNPKEIANKVMQMSLRQRKDYFDHPLHSNKDYLRYICRTSPLRVPLVWLGRTLNLYCPNFYYKISGIRQ